MLPKVTYPQADTRLSERKGDLLSQSAGPRLDHKRSGAHVYGQTEREAVLHLNDIELEEQDINHRNQTL